MLIRSRMHIMCKRDKCVSEDMRGDTNQGKGRSSPGRTNMFCEKKQIIFRFFSQVDTMNGKGKWTIKKRTQRRENGEGHDKTRKRVEWG